MDSRFSESGRDLVREEDLLLFHSNLLITLVYANVIHVNKVGSQFNPRATKGGGGGYHPHTFLCIIFFPYGIYFLNFR